MKKITGADILRDFTAGKIIGYHEYYPALEVQAERRKDNETISRQLAKIADMGNQQDALGKKITKLQARIAELESELEAHRDAVAKLNKTYIDLLILYDAALTENKNLREALDELDEIKRSYAEVMAEPCGTDDQMHCTCVPALRKGLEAYRAKVRRLVEAASAIEQNWKKSGWGYNEQLRNGLNQAIAEVENE